MLGRGLGADCLLYIPICKKQADLTGIASPSSSLKSSACHRYSIICLASGVLPNADIGLQLARCRFDLDWHIIGTTTSYLLSGCLCDVLQVVMHCILLKELLISMSFAAAHLKID